MSYLHNYDYTPDPGPFSGFLRRGESLVWKGQPDRKAYLGSASRAWLLFAASVLLVVGTLALHRPEARYGCLFVAAVCSSITRRRVCVARRAESVQYGVTEERLMIHVAGRRSELFAYDLRTTPVQHVEEWGCDACIPLQHQGEASRRVCLPAGKEPLGSIHFAVPRPAPLWTRVALPDAVACARVPAFVILPSPAYVYRVIEDAYTRLQPRHVRVESPVFEMPEDVEFGG